MLPLKSLWTFFHRLNQRALCLRRQMTDARFEISLRREARAPPPPPPPNRR